MTLRITPPTNDASDQTARLAGLWEVFTTAERQWFAAICSRGEAILRDAGNDELADVLAREAAA